LSLQAICTVGNSVRNKAQGSWRREGIPIHVLLPRFIHLFSPLLA
jgi:hypothetical protein